MLSCGLPIELAKSWYSSSESKTQTRDGVRLLDRERERLLEVAAVDDETLRQVRRDLRGDRGLDDVPARLSFLNASFQSGLALNRSRLLPRSLRPSDSGRFSIARLTSRLASASRARWTCSCARDTWTQGSAGSSASACSKAFSARSSSSRSARTSPRAAQAWRELHVLRDRRLEIRGRLLALIVVVRGDAREPEHDGGLRRDADRFLEELERLVRSVLLDQIEAGLDGACASAGSPAISVICASSSARNRSSAIFAHAVA